MGLVAQVTRRDFIGAATCVSGTAAASLIKPCFMNVPQLKVRLFKALPRIAPPELRIGQNAVYAF